MSKELRLPMRPTPIVFHSQLQRGVITTFSTTRSGVQYLGLGTPLAGLPLRPRDDKNAPGKT